MTPGLISSLAARTINQPELAKPAESIGEQTDLFQKIFGELTTPTKLTAKEEVEQQIPKVVATKLSSESATGTLTELALVKSGVLLNNGEELIELATKQLDSETVETSEVSEVKPESEVDLETITQELLAWAGMMGVGLPIKLNAEVLNSAKTPLKMVIPAIVEVALSKVTAGVEAEITSNPEARVMAQPVQSLEREVCFDDELTKDKALTEMVATGNGSNVLSEMMAGLTEKLSITQVTKSENGSEEMKQLLSSATLFVQPEVKIAPADSPITTAILASQMGKLESLTQLIATATGVATKKVGSFATPPIDFLSELGITASKLKSSKGIFPNNSFELPLLKVISNKEVGLAEEIPVVSLPEFGLGLTENTLTLESNLLKPVLNETHTATENETLDFNAVLAEQLNKAEPLVIEASTKVETTEKVTAKEILPQIVERTQLMVAGGYHEMELNLQPENLGKLHLKISLENQLVTAHFLAESQQVKEIIESNLSQLRQKLQATGLQIDKLQVNLGQDGYGSNHQPPRSDQEEVWLNQRKPATRVTRIEPTPALESVRALTELSTRIDFVA